MAYLMEGQFIRRVADGALIPVDPGNTDWQAWQADGAAADIDVPAMRSAADAALTAAAAAAITGGVTLDVTGESLFYPSAPTDQANLTAVVVLSTLSDTPPDWAQPLTTRDAAGVWDRRSHTAAQVQAVGRAVAAHVDACRARLAERRAALAAAQTIEQVQAVVW